MKRAALPPAPVDVWSGDQLGFLPCVHRPAKKRRLDRAVRCAKCDRVLKP